MRAAHRHQSGHPGHATIQQSCLRPGWLGAGGSACVFSLRLVGHPFCRIGHGRDAPVCKKTRPSLTALNRSIMQPGAIATISSGPRSGSGRRIQSSTSLPCACGQKCACALIMTWNPTGENGFASIVRRQHGAGGSPQIRMERVREMKMGGCGLNIQSMPAQYRLSS